MSFPAYEEYKESGVDWLGTIPVGWALKLVKRIASIKYGIGEPPKYQEEGIRLVRATNIRRGVISGEGMVYVDPTHIPEQRIVWLKEGDIIVVRSGAYTGDSAIIPDGYGEAIAGFDMVLRIHDAVPQFVQYALLSNYVKEGQLDLMRMRAAQPHLNAEELGGCQFVAPPSDEQKAISAFLDAETSKIDSLVSEQRRLIELLKEKRQAVISHAVTKGLNPNAPMKPSGIQWLGDVPEHWEVKKLRYFAEVLRGKFTHRPRNDPSFYDGDFPFVQTGEITGASKFITGYRQTLNERGISVSKQFPKGTLVMAIAANIGDVAILDFHAYFPDSIVGLVPNGTADVMYMYYLMQAMKQPMVQTATISTQMNLNVEQICSLSAACPPAKEQQAIADFLDKQVEKFSQLQAEAERAIELLQERRTALISAAVTGKIDVRGFADKEAVA